MEPHHRNVPKPNRSFARRMRRVPTDAEQRLWHLLRSRRLEHLKFRRQAPIGRFIVDFVCHSHKIIIELDGGQHAEKAADMERDAWLNRIGYRVVRIWNNEMFENPNGVLEHIVSVVAGGA
jgi:very-short-patch-repair endonuclease